MAYTLNRHGAAPFQVAVVHGGPGAAGSAAPLARGLAESFGVLEPIQTADSVSGQARELAEALIDNFDSPGVLVGWSWGAWLSLVVTAQRPALVKKLILIGSPPYEVRQSMGLMETRLNRLSEADRSHAIDLMEKLGNPDAPGMSEALAQYGALMMQADTFDPEGLLEDVPAVDFSIYQKVWSQAMEMRKNGELLALAEKVRCAVTAIHGDYDPHPSESVREALGRVFDDFRFVKLAKCGHYPWHERQAKERFFQVVRDDISATLMSR